MRRRLALLSLATTALVVIALLVPLGLLVRRQAADRARVQAEREAQTLSSVVGLTLAVDSSEIAIASTVGPLDRGEIVVLSDGTVIGTPQPGQGLLVEVAFEDQATVTMVVNDGWEVALPVIGRDSSAVVDVFVTNEELTEGVYAAWALLGLLGFVLVVAAVLVADRLGASLVRPIEDLADAARRMGDGDLDARVEPSNPKEIREVGEAFNQLARRLDQLMLEERESVADLSHRLRTPVTSLRLQVEKLTDRDERDQVLAQLGRLEQSIDQMIVAARSGTAAEVGRCELDVVVVDRAAFWHMLAVEQDRDLTFEAGAPGVVLGVARDSLEAVIDALVGNVFDHTPAGTNLALRTGEDLDRPWLEVTDEGTGFPDSSLLQRGISGKGSTGLGLDIAKRTAEITGGELEVATTDLGARVRVWFG